LKEVGIEKPTQIQYDTLKHSLKGKNVIGCAYTGSGKTACFALPVL
jgi:superfamily II DNA/RNA helicase